MSSTLNEIVKLIENVQDEFFVMRDPFSYNVLNKKREELLKICRGIGDKESVFEQNLTTLNLNKKYSCYSSSDWGYYTPSIIERYASVNVHRPKRLFPKKPDKEHYYEYLYSNDTLVAIKYYYRDKNTSTHYFLKVRNSLFSFYFRKDETKFAKVFELAYDDNEKLKYFCNLKSWSENLEVTNDFFKHKRYMFQDCNLLDYHYFHNNNGIIDFVDYYTRIYNFSPAISGLKLGARFYFLNDSEGGIIKTYSNTEFSPCIFLADNQETYNSGKK